MYLEFLIPYFLNYGIIISFLAGLLFGVESIMILAFLGVNSALSYVVLFSFGFLGMVVSDSIYFAIGKYRLFSRLNSGYNVHISKRMDKALHSLTKKNLFLTMMYTKIAYGISIATLIYFGSKEISWKKFLKINVTLNLIGVSIAMILGWLAGHGYKSILTISKKLGLAIGFVFLFIIVLIILKSFFNREVEREIEK